MTIEANIPYEVLLEETIDRLQGREEFLTGLLDSFWTGNVPDNATLDHMVLAKAGRLRLEEKAKVCALLGGGA